MIKYYRALIIQFVIWILILVGWCINLYKFIQCDFEPINKTEIVRGVGIFVFPIGAIISIFDIGEENER